MAAALSVEEHIGSVNRSDVGTADTRHKVSTVVYCVRVQ